MGFLLDEVRVLHYSSFSVTPSVPTLLLPQKFYGGVNYFSILSAR